jgi:hypothetical protein
MAYPHCRRSFVPPMPCSIGLTSVLPYNIFFPPLKRKEFLLVAVGNPPGLAGGSSKSGQKKRNKEPESAALPGLVLICPSVNFTRVATGEATG